MITIAQEQFYFIDSGVKGALDHQWQRFESICRDIYIRSKRVCSIGVANKRDHPSYFYRASEMLNSSDCSHILLLGLSRGNVVTAFFREAVLVFSSAFDLSSFKSPSRRRFATASNTTTGATVMDAFCLLNCVLSVPSCHFVLLHRWALLRKSFTRVLQIGHETSVEAWHRVDSCR